MNVTQKKPKIALYWCSSCGGCEESVIDLAEDILAIYEAVDIVFWPVAMDFRTRDIERLDDGEIFLTLINGAVRMDEQAAMAGLLRKKSKLLIAHGACAHLGGVVGLANLFTGKEVLSRSYKEVPTVKNAMGILPQVQTVEDGRKLYLSGFHDTVKSLDQVVTVDYYIPGCPPTPELVKKAITKALRGDLPRKGSVLAEKKALCHTCPRTDSRPDKLRIKAFKRLYDSEWNSSECFLDQGIICLGPATRGGCGSQCIRANMPCRGCFGPTDGVIDQGAKSLSFLSSVIDSKDLEELERIAGSIPDPVGLFYRYSLAVSVLKGRIFGRTP